HGDVLMWLMKTLLTSGCTNQRGAGQQVMHPAYYQALYLQELEIMYFLVEPAFMRAGVLTQQWTDSQSPYDAADTILKLMGRH
ncbi:hypothetical protein KSX62_18935, partial [Enterobacter hormaechei]|nr:hypothetical protein [Enterobacter hormaechei]MBY0745626.1 hypothetical protein [Enterobacter sp. M607]MBU8931716.1 hypothetical protein [Enterobacter hormaechei]MBU8938821.1 hypothetical protein [Enterobacter hormaechei]MBU8948260.1 hypothetical protein [Enterobacter hormaechei]